MTGLVADLPALYHQSHRVGARVRAAVASGKDLAEADSSEAEDSSEADSVVVFVGDHLHHRHRPVVEVVEEASPLHTLHSQ